MECEEILIKGKTVREKEKRRASRGAFPHGEEAQHGGVGAEFTKNSSNGNEAAFKLTIGF